MLDLLFDELENVEEIETPIDTPEINNMPDNLFTDYENLPY